MATSSNQKKFGATSSQKGFAGSADQRTFTNTVVASTVGTIIPHGVENGIVTQSGAYLLTQSGGFLIIN